MIQNYLKIAWRNLVKNKMYGLINIGGLAVGMAVVMVIGLWVYDEVSYNRSHKNYEHIAQVYRRNTEPLKQKTDSYFGMPSRWRACWRKNTGTCSSVSFCFGGMQATPFAWVKIVLPKPVNLSGRV